jgi:PAS domain S-box-containing protein
MSNNRQSLKKAILIPLLGVLAAALAFMAIQHYFSFHDLLTKRLQERASRLADLVGFIAGSTGAPAELQHIVSAIGGESEVNMIVVLAGDPARVVASSRMSMLGKPVSELSQLDVKDDVQITSTNSAVMFRYHSEAKEFDYWRPLSVVIPGLGGHQLERGFVFVHLDTRNIEKKVRASTGNMVMGYFVAMLLLAVCCWLLLNRHVLRPLTAISDAVGRFQTSNATRVTGADHLSKELAGLADSWNVLADKLEREEMERRQAEEALKERALLAVMEAEVGTALTRGGTLAEMLRLCSEAIVRQLDAAFARIWTLNEPEKMLELQASAGLYTHLNGPHGRVPVGKFKIGLIAEEREAHLTNQVVGDPRVGDQDWAKREGMIAFAGYPLLVEDRLVGVVALFARHPLTDTTLQALAAISNSIALGIERKQAERAIVESEEKFRQLAENIADVFYMTSPDLQQTHYASPAYEHIWGRSIAGLYADPHEWAEAILPEDRERVWATFSALAADEPTVSVEFRIARPDGDVRWILSRGFQVRDASGKVIRITGIATDVTERKRAEAELEAAHKQLLETSRQAGMAEVATNVLHNVGNVLNSVNVSATLIADHLRKSKIASLGKVTALLGEHATDLGAFFTSNPKGQQLPGYLSKLAEHLLEEHKGAVAELESLGKNIEHIKEIVAMQQSYATFSGVTETMKFTELVEDALRMNEGALTRHEVQVIREYEEVPPVTIDKHKVLQILVNLIRNAKYACDESGRPDKQMTMRVAGGDNQVKISISDNGVGIPAENLTRIFNHGFTTRKEGHGFGLHSGALAAKEMGGTLQAHSDGVGQGATFILELPLKPLVKLAA